MNKPALHRLLLIAALALSAPILAAHALAAPGPCGDHPWLRMPPPGVEAEHPAPLYLEVQPAAREQAAALLAQRPILRITPEQAAQFTGETAQSWVPGLTYLLRGVRNADTDSRYAISYDESGAVVVHFAARRTGAPYSAPMVAVLEQPPAALYVSCIAGQ